MDYPEPGHLRTSSDYDGTIESEETNKIGGRENKRKVALYGSIGVVASRTTLEFMSYWSNYR